MSHMNELTFLSLRLVGSSFRRKESILQSVFLYEVLPGKTSKVPPLFKVVYTRCPIYEGTR